MEYTSEYSKLKDVSRNVPMIARPSWPYPLYTDENARNPLTKFFVRFLRYHRPAPPRPPHWNKRLETDVSRSCVLGESITRWISQITIKPSPCVDFVITSVRSIVHSAAAHMASKYPFCSGCYVVDFGSMAESTRIIKPDEFDFIIAFPTLNTQAITKTLSSGRLFVNVATVSVDPSLFADIDKKYLIRGVLQRIFVSTLCHCLPVGWCFFEENVSGKTIADKTFNFHLKYNGNESNYIEVSVDVCFGIPLSPEDLDNFLVDNDSSVSFLRHLQKQCEMEETTLIAILEPHTFSNRFNAINFSFLSETSTFIPGSSHSSCYMLAKFICRTFLPKIQKENGKCPRCLDCLIRSYHLKSVMLYLMDHYPDVSHWAESKLGNRLIEVFEIMRICIQKGFHDYRALYPLSSVPPNSFSDPTYSPKYGTLTIDSERRRCYIPSLEGMQRAVGESSQQLVNDYWKFLSRTPWTSKQVIDKLVCLLYALKKCKIKE